ncbi:unnamed protein product, partial [Didymodactylos carnosus]
LGGSSNNSIASERGIFEKTCSKLYGLMVFPRKVVDVQVLIPSPLRIRAKVEITDPSTGSKDHFFVEGSVCQNGFNQYAADAVCRSLGEVGGVNQEADMAIGWIDMNGQLHFEDRHAPGFVLPVKDSTTQDWFGLQGREENNWTAIQFKQFVVCCMWWMLPRLLP